MGVFTSLLDHAVAYIVSPPMTLGNMVKQSTQVIVVKVEKVDRVANVIFWRKLREIKGTWPADLITHAAELVTTIEAIAAGNEVVIPCRLDGQVLRMRSSLKLLDHNPKRDGVE